jgi:hypothetical protein
MGNCLFHVTKLLLNIVTTVGNPLQEIGRSIDLTQILQLAAKSARRADESPFEGLCRG